MRKISDKAKPSEREGKGNNFLLLIENWGIHSIVGDKITELGTTRSGFPPNIAAVLSYTLTVLTGAIMFMIEKENKYVRFHALQSILFGATWMILWTLASIGITRPIRIIGFIITDVILFVVVLGGFVTWLFLLYGAYRGARFKLPVLGNIAERIM